VSTTILNIGASGLVGGALLREFSPHCRTIGTFFRNGDPTLKQLDLRDRSAVRAVLHDVRPDVILCPAAEPNVELCEIHPVATRLVNVEGLRNIVEATAEIGALLVYFSSEYVFDGTRGLYSEDDACNPLNEYGRQKLECERMIATQLDRYIIGRISGVYGWEMRRKNFVVRFIDCLSAGGTFKVPCDQLITPTYAPNLARLVRWLVEGGHRGLFHLSGSLSLPRVDFAHLIADVFDLNPALIMPIPTLTLGLRAVRPRAAGLSTAKAQALVNLPVMDPREGLRAMSKFTNFSRRGGVLPSALGTS
jgi:dTDP-4-dehydrorhamnose reductase